MHVRDTPGSGMGIGLVAAAYTLYSNWPAAVGARQRGGRMLRWMGGLSQPSSRSLHLETCSAN